ncbi:MAG: TetR/AcrR family transcriptional regulator [Solirubrobacteraceae bacterium]
MNQTLLQRALDAGAGMPVEDELSDRVLDAALALAGESGLGNLTMDDIALRAGVGRMTVYRRFASKRRLVDALSLREARRCLAALEQAIDPAAAPDEQIAGALIAGLRIARGHPLLNRLALTDPRGLLDSLNDGGLFELARSFAVERLRPAGLGEAQAEIMLRLGLSLLLLPASVLPLEDPVALRELVRRAI